MNDCENDGKSFSFECGYCEYMYETNVVYKPKSLLNIIKDEMNDGFHKYCEDIKTEYWQIKNHHHLLLLKVNKLEGIYNS